MRNRAKCRSCNDIIESKSGHDWVQCSCKEIFVDGGQCYERYGYTEPENFCRLNDDDTENEEANKRLVEHYAQLKRDTEEYYAKRALLNEKPS